MIAINGVGPSVRACVSVFVDRGPNRCEAWLPKPFDHQTGTIEVLARISHGASGMAIATRGEALAGAHRSGDPCVSEFTVFAVQTKGMPYSSVRPPVFEGVNICGWLGNLWRRRTSWAKQGVGAGVSTAVRRTSPCVAG